MKIHLTILFALWRYCANVARACFAFRSLPLPFRVHFVNTVWPALEPRCATTTVILAWLDLFLHNERSEQKSTRLLQPPYQTIRQSLEHTFHRMSPARGKQRGENGKCVKTPWKQKPKVEII